MFRSANLEDLSWPPLKSKEVLHDGEMPQI